jgi:hypothetical protein
MKLFQASQVKFIQLPRLQKKCSYLLFYDPSWRNPFFKLGYLMKILELCPHWTWMNLNLLSSIFVVGKPGDYPKILPQNTVCRPACRNRTVRVLYIHIYRQVYMHIIAARESAAQLHCRFSHFIPPWTHWWRVNELRWTVNLRSILLEDLIKWVWRLTYWCSQLAR